MKNRSSIESVVVHLKWEFDSEAKDAEGKIINVPNPNELRLLLLSSGISKKDIDKFVKRKGSVNYKKVREEMSASEKFLLDLASNLMPHLVNSKREMLKRQMRVDNYIFGVNGKFRKSTKYESDNFKKTGIIRTIEIYKDDNNRYRVCVNNEMLSWFRPKQTTEKPYWQYIYEIANEGKSSVSYVKKIKGIVSWFRSDKENPIYKNTGLKPTKILEFEGDTLRASPLVTIKKMTQKKAYSREEQ